MSEGGEPQLETGYMGGVDTITRADLLAMQSGQYVFHARGGRLTKIPVEKSLVPRDPKGHNQAVSLSLASDGTAYVSQATTMSKSEDGGRTWKAHPVSEGGAAQVLSDGTFLRASADSGPGAEGPGKVTASTDEGRTWKKWAEVEIDLPVQHSARAFPRSLTRLPDDVLLWAVQAREIEYKGTSAAEQTRYVPGITYLFSYRSIDSGRTWDGPAPMQASGSEGGTTRLSSGRLLATVRYQPPGYKHIQLNESGDGGRTWENLRLLTTVFGQCHGVPTALPDGTVVVIHDHRYGPDGVKPPDIPMNEKVASPGVPGGRAMVSRDEGRTWEDEVYYLYYGDSDTGYSQSAVLDDGTILSIVGTCDYPGAATQWDGATGRSDLTAIRWRPVE